MPSQDAAPVEWARWYGQARGWVLCGLEPGTKGPKTEGWNTPERWLDSPERREAYWRANPDHGMGLIHGPSGTVALDVDDVERTRDVFAEFGIDLDAVLGAGLQMRGKQGRAKAIFRAPAGQSLAMHKAAWIHPTDRKQSITLFELRAGPVQDVLPPSRHPDGHRYEWAADAQEWVAAHGGQVPALPEPLFAFWREWTSVAPQVAAMSPWATAETPAAKAPLRLERSGHNDVIGAFNRANDVRGLLESHGYARHGRRYLAPSSESRLPGVSVLSDGRVYSHHGSDPLADGFPHDAFDVFRILECGGDNREATRRAGEALGISVHAPSSHDFSTLLAGEGYAGRDGGASEATAPEGGQRRRFQFVSADDLDSLPDPEPLIEGRVFRDTLVSIVAPFDHYKTFFALAMALHIGTGIPWCMSPVTPGVVVYIVAEGVHGIKQRVAAWKAAEAYAGSLNVYFLPASVAFTERGDVAELLKAIAELPAPPVAVFVDTLSRNFGGGDQSASQDMGAFIRGLDVIREATGATMVVIHHTGWEGTRSRGASDLPAAMDTEITLARREGGTVVAICTKQKDAARFEPLTFAPQPVNGTGSIVLAWQEGAGPSAPAETRRRVANYVVLLEALWSNFGPSGATHGEWLAKARLGKSSFNEALKTLKQETYVRLGRDDHYTLTDAGRLKLGPEVQPWSNVGLEARSNGPVQSPPLGGMDSDQPEMLPLDEEAA